MIMEMLDTLFQSMACKGAGPEKFLESDLGIDFNERLCIREDLEERLHVIISDDEIEHDLTMLDLAGLLSRKLLVTPGQEGFEGKLVEDTVILASALTVSRNLREVSAWPQLLPHVRDVRLTYDDGLHQEFYMDMANGAGHVAAVRFVRRCEIDHIAYFQPEPASFLRFYCGDWFIRPLAQNATHLTSVQRWTLSTKAELMFPTKNGISARQQISALLREDARIALRAWKISLEL